MIRYSCPVCGAQMESEDAIAGKIDVCGSCKATVRVPVPPGLASERPAAEAPATPAASPPPAEAPAPVAPAPEPVTESAPAPAPEPVMESAPAPAPEPAATDPDDPFAALLGETQAAPAAAASTPAASDDPLAALAGAADAKAPVAKASPATATPARAVAARRAGPAPPAPTAKASLICGVIGLLVFPVGIYGLILAIKAKKAITQSSGQFGPSPAGTFGMLLGGLDAFLTLMLIVMVLLWVTGVLPTPWSDSPTPPPEQPGAPETAPPAEQAPLGGTDPGPTEPEMAPSKEPAPKPKPELKPEGAGTEPAPEPEGGAEPGPTEMDDL